MFPEHKISVYYGQDDSPLERMIAALEDVEDQTAFIRVDGIHFGWLTGHARTMLEQAEKEGLDCVKTEDDFPIQLTSDIYRLGALKKHTPFLRNDPTVHRIVSIPNSSCSMKLRNSGVPA